MGQTSDEETGNSYRIFVWQVSLKRDEKET